MSNRYRGPSIDASYQVLVHLEKQFQKRRFFRNQPINNKNCLWRLGLIMGRDEMNLWIIWPSVFFRNWPIRNKNCLWRPCLLTDQDKMCNRYREPSIDASYQVSIHLAKGFQRRRLKCEKLMDDGRQVMVKAHIRLAR